MNRRFFSTEPPIKYEFNLKKQRTTNKRGAEGGTRREKERGVYVSCSANKQKVNTGEGNTVTLDAAERIPLRFPRRPFLLATGQKQRRKKANTSRLPRLWETMASEKKSHATPSVCRDLNTLPFFALPSTFSWSLLPEASSTAQQHAAGSESLRLRCWQHIRKNRNQFSSCCVASLAGESWHGLNGGDRAIWA